MSNFSSKIFKNNETTQRYVPSSTSSLSSSSRLKRLLTAKFTSKPVRWSSRTITFLDFPCKTPWQKNAEHTIFLKAYKLEQRYPFFNIWLERAYYEQSRIEPLYFGHCWPSTTGYKGAKLLRMLTVGITGKQTNWRFEFYVFSKSQQKCFQNNAEIRKPKSFFSVADKF